MPTTHECWPLHVAGVLRATCNLHFWQPIGALTAAVKAGAR